MIDYFYYTALTVAALYENASAAERSGWPELLTAHQAQLREWAENYPPTFADKHALVSAEIARVEGRCTDALRQYDEAIEAAREHGFVQNQGIAHELGRPFMPTAARRSPAAPTLTLRKRAVALHAGGAHGKVRQ